MIARSPLFSVSRAWCHSSVRKKGEEVQPTVKYTMRTPPSWSLVLLALFLMEGRVADSLSGKSKGGDDDGRTAYMGRLEEVLSIHVSYV